MFRRILCAVAILGIAVAVAQAERMRVRITKIGDGKITVKVFDKATKKFSEDEKTLEVAEGVKVNMLSGKKGNIKKEAVDGGLKAKLFRKLGKKGRVATIVVDDTSGKVTQIDVRGGGKKKKKKTDG